MLVGGIGILRTIYKSIIALKVTLRLEYVESFITTKHFDKYFCLWEVYSTWTLINHQTATPTFMSFEKFFASLLSKKHCLMNFLILTTEHVMF